MKVQTVHMNVLEEPEIYAEHVELLTNLDLAVMTMTCVGSERQSQSWICRTTDSAYEELRARHPLGVIGERHTIMKTKNGSQWRQEEFRG